MQLAASPARFSTASPSFEADFNARLFWSPAADALIEQRVADILRDVQGAASGYGVAIMRADVKDLIFPGNLQEIMNRVLAAERMSQAQLVEARTKAEVQRIEAATKADGQRVQSQADADAIRLDAQAQADATRLAVLAEVQALEERQRLASAYQQHPALLRLEELAALKDLGANANARLYLDFGGRVKVEAEA